MFCDVSISGYKHLVIAVYIALERFQFLIFKSTTFIPTSLKLSLVALENLEVVFRFLYKACRYNYFLMGFVAAVESYKKSHFPVALPA